jgi:hypothetical protein
MKKADLFSVFSYQHFTIWLHSVTVIQRDPISAICSPILLSSGKRQVNDVIMKSPNPPLALFMTLNRIIQNKKVQTPGIRTFTIAIYLPLAIYTSMCFIYSLPFWRNTVKRLLLFQLQIAANVLQHVTRVCLDSQRYEIDLAGPEFRILICCYFTKSGVTKACLARYLGSICRTLGQILAQPGHVVSLFCHKKRLIILNNIY